MSLRPVAFSIPSTTELKVTFSDSLSKKISSDNFKIVSLNGSVSDLDILGVTIDNSVVIVKTKPQVAGNYYLLKFIDTQDVLFTSLKGDPVLNDSVSRELFFVGIDNINPVRDRMFELVPNLFHLENTNLKNILSSQAEEFYTAQKTVGEVLSNNYLSIEVVDELRSRTAGPTDRLANENAYEILRVSRSLTGEKPKTEVLDYTVANTFERLNYIPNNPISLQQIIVSNEVINIDSKSNGFDGFLISLKNKNVIKILSIKYIAYGEEEDCDGNIGTFYNIERYKYSIKNNFYDQNYAFKFSGLKDNQILLSEFGNLPRPSILDTFIISYLYKNQGRNILEDQVEVSRVEESINEPIPPNITRFFLGHAPIVTISNAIPNLNGVTFKVAENFEERPLAFKKEILFDISKIPSIPGEYSINYNTGEVYVAGGTKVGEGTGQDNFVATYYYRKEFLPDLDYTIYKQDLVATPDRGLFNDEAEIKIVYEDVFAKDVDYIAKSHIEVMPEFVENRLSQSFRIKTKNSPITDVFRIINQTTREQYNALYHTANEIAFSGGRSPEIKNEENEEAIFSSVDNEELAVIGEFVVPAFRARIISTASYNNIIFSPGIPAELISQNSTQYFFREIYNYDVTANISDINILFFGDPDSNNLITSAGIGALVVPPSLSSEVIIGTKAFIINLSNERILNKNLDSIGMITNSSLELSDDSVFKNEKWFDPVNITPSIYQTNDGGISRAFVDSKGTKFEENISRLRKVGDYTIDYNHGIIYVAVKKQQDLSIGTAKYFYGDVETSFKNIITASGAAKKRNSPDDISTASIIYNKISNTADKISILDLENSLTLYDGITEAQDQSGNRHVICDVREDYTALVSHPISSINSIFKIADLTGSNLNSPSLYDRQSEYSKEDLLKTVSDGGRNIYDVTSVYYEDNVIDFKKRQRKRVNTNGSNFIITVSDLTATSFYQAKALAKERVVFGEDLNITKLDKLQIVDVEIISPGIARVDISNLVGISTLDTDNDYLIDKNGDRFKIINVNAGLSRIRVQVPAENDASVNKPKLDPVGVSKVVVMAGVTYVDGKMIIDIPGDSGLAAGEMLEITYLTSQMPEIGTALAVDYRFGFIFLDYVYVADNIVVWYEYGDNSIDWTISDSIQEGEQYYVTYKYGALRNYLRVNFGTLTNIPFFKNFGINTDRELYRDAIKGVLQTFPKGPTIPAYKDLIKAFTKINPEIKELAFGNWILGRDYLAPQNIEYKGVLKFADGKFNQGLMFNDDVSVNIPSISSISLDEGTLEAWIRPEWAGINNDATLTFNINHIGKESFFLREGRNPFDYGWDVVPVKNRSLSGSTDSTGGYLSISNYRSDSSKPNDLDVGYYGIYKNQENLDRTIDSKTSATFKISMVGTHYNDLREEVTLPEALISCDITSAEPEDSHFIIGESGPGSFVGGPFPISFSSPSSIYNVGALLIPDGKYTAGISLVLRQVPEFKFDVVNNDSESDLLVDFNAPYYVKPCKCYPVNNIPKLEKFRNLSIKVDINDVFDLSFFKSSINIIDDSPESFILVDGEGVFYQVIGFYNSLGVLYTKNIPSDISSILIYKFGINNTDLSTKNYSIINNSIPKDSIRLMYKGAEIISSYNPFNSKILLDFEKEFLLNWSSYNSFEVIRKPLENLVTFKINNFETNMFYTDSLASCNLNIDLDISDGNFRGQAIGVFSKYILSTLDLLRINGVIYNKYDASDIYIGGEGWNPSRVPFSVNRSDYPRSPVGEPPGADSKGGLFLWFDDLCKSPLSEEIGQWIFRTRYNRTTPIPIGVRIVDGVWSNVYEDIFTNYNVTGTITTDGEFSSVSRSYRSESSGNCENGINCEANFRYCGNQLLEEFGWSKIDESESEMINVIVGGVESQSGKWAKFGGFPTSKSDGIYRMGPSSDTFDCVESEDILGNLAYTVNPCPNGDLEYVVSARVAQYDAAIAGSLLGIFSGIISGNFTGMVPIAITDNDISIKIALGFSSDSQPLVMILDGISNNILEYVPFIWTDYSFHEYRLVKNKENKRVSIYIDNLLVSRIRFIEFGDTSTVGYQNFKDPHVALYLFDHSLLNISEYHYVYDPNILDVDLIFYSASDVSGDKYLENNDTIISTDSKVEFSFTINNLDGYGKEAYDEYGYDNYADYYGVDELFITSDRRRFLVDSGLSEGDRRFSIFKDGKGFLNFRIFDDSFIKKNQSEMFNLATNIKHFRPGELHHVAASWKLNTINNKDEMHLFIDGQEAPNIFKFGGKVPIRLNDKFRDVSKEVLYDFLAKDIDFCQLYTDGSVVVGSAIFNSSQVGFTEDMVGRSLIFESVDGDTNDPLVGQEYIVKSIIDGNNITLGRGDNVDVVAFSVNVANINFRFPPTAGIISPILTDIRNSKLSIFRTKPNGSVEEMSGLFYTIELGEVNIAKGSNVINPKFRANLDTRIIEFVGKNSRCKVDATVQPTDVDIHIKTYGLNLENVKYKLGLASSSYVNDEGSFSGKSVIKNASAQPVSLEDVIITRIILDKTAISVINPEPIDELGYLIDFEILLDNTDKIYSLTSEEGLVYKQNLGRFLTLTFDSDNINYCKFDGYDYYNTYEGYNALRKESYITIYGTTVSGQTSETFPIDKNGLYTTTNLFKTVTKVLGRLIVIDPDYIDAGIISLRESDPISVSNNGGSKADVYDYVNEHMILTTFGSAGTYPFELHPGYYSVEFPAYLTINLPEVGHKMYIGSNFYEKEQFGGVIDQFRIISEMSNDTRVTELYTAGTRSVTDEYNKAIPACPDSQTLTLLPFNDPRSLQVRRLRNTSFLDQDNNIKYKLSREKQESLMQVVNDQRLFISRMLNWGYSLEDSTKTFYEVHRAGGGPLFNEADYYRNVDEFPKSNRSVNDLFGSSGNFTNGKGLLLLNNDGKFRRDEGSIEFWVSPTIDSFDDKEYRYFVDIFSGKMERITSKTSTVIELNNAANKIINIKLLKKTREFKDLYTPNEAQTIIFDEIARSSISGVLEGGSGSDKDFSIGARLSPDGKKIFLAESLPAQNTDVVVTYVPLDSSGDRFSIYKNDKNQIVFLITANGIDNVVSIDVDWKKNTWHRILCVYKTNSLFDTMRIFCDGDEGGYILYGTGLSYGTGYYYGQYIQKDGQFKNKEYKIPLSDEFKLISIGSDIFGDKNCRSRLDNIRFSKIIRNTVLDSAGNSIDINYSPNLNTVFPVVKDNSTTLMLDFDADMKKVENFATVIDPKKGIYNFDIEVIDNFDKVIDVNDGQIEDLIVELVNRLKPAHTNALVKFTKTRC